METCIQIKLAIYNHFKVDFDTRSRKRKHYYLRALYFALCRKNTGMTLGEIGRSLNNKFDHATVLNAISKFKVTIKNYEPKIYDFYMSFHVIKVPTVKRVDLLKGIIEV